MGFADRQETSTSAPAFWNEVRTASDLADEAVAGIQFLRARQDIDGSASGAAAMAAQNDWWCCFADSDCYPYGGTRCIGGQVCGVCVP